MVHGAFLVDASLCLGMVSTGSLICLGVPQIYENWRRKSTIGLSEIFISMRLAGDIFWLLGCFLSHQLLSVKLVGLCNAAMDLAMLFQIFYYTYIMEESDLTQRIDISSVVLNPTPQSSKIFPLKLFSFSLFILFIFSFNPTGSQTPPISTHRRLLEVDSLCVVDDCSDRICIFGLVAAWVSALFSGCSRIPQIITNQKRKSTEGLSIGMFLFNLLANSSLLLSILVICQQGDYILHQSPYLTGSSIAVILDTYIVFQIIFYSKRGEIERVEDDYEGLVNENPKYDDEKEFLPEMNNCIELIEIVSEKNDCQLKEEEHEEINS
jgi:solute carrier family 66 (lysosomal lysine-arginine transporter), member 1